MAPVVRGLTLNGYDIFQIEINGNLYGGGEYYMHFIPGTERANAKDGGGTFWTFECTLSRNGLDNALEWRKLPMMDSVIATIQKARDVYSYILHEMYDPEFSETIPESPESVTQMVLKF
jgi:hypothetical protein